MRVARSVLLIPLIAAFAVTGCHTRTGSGGGNVEQEEAANERDRLSAENGQLRAENAGLKTDLANARNQLAAKPDSVGTQLNKIINGPEIEGTTSNGRGGLALDEDFAFAKGSADLSPEGKKTIEKIAARLNEGEYKGAKVIVEGHTDDTPVSRASTKEKYTDNWGLSGARAAAVTRALQVAGLDAHRIHGAFRGEYAPRPGANDKAKNRRVEIYLGSGD
ncbi:MAG: OmpA family protein [Planctomycetes bacterium]|nr:OmpA family protein [Planctomycetota bacterium]